MTRKTSPDGTRTYYFTFERTNLRIDDFPAALSITGLVCVFKQINSYKPGEIIPRETAAKLLKIYRNK